MYTISPSGVGTMYCAQWEWGWVECIVYIVGIRIVPSGSVEAVGVDSSFGDRGMGGMVCMLHGRLRLLKL